MKIPRPREQLAGCIWLPRILTKARLLKSGELSPEYAARFCHPTGVDNAFLSYFGLSREDIVRVAELPDAGAAEWFIARFGREKIADWNQVAVNMGRPGFPLAERLPVALATSYKHIDPAGKETIFEVLEADESDDAPSGR